MRKADKFWAALAILPLLLVIVVAVMPRRPVQAPLATEVSTPAPLAGEAPRTADALFADWADEYAEQGLVTKTPIALRFSRAFSKHFTNAQGNVRLNFESSQVAVSIEGLEPLAAGARYELWLIDQVPGEANTAAIDLGDDGDRILNLGPLTGGSLTTTLAARDLSSYAVDMAAVMRLAPGQMPEFVIGGMQSIRYQVGRLGQAKQSLTLEHLGGNRALPITLVAGANSPKQKQLVAAGLDLFANGTFGGNGRTCATCHPLPPLGDLTIDRQIIDDISVATAGLDPLFVAEFDPNLPPFNFDNDKQPAMESPILMRERGLILENISGFEKNALGNFINAPFFRATPALFNMNLTQPFGLGGDIPDLQLFSTGAVVQHFTQTLDRVAGEDFVLPTADELKALEAFMLSLSSPASGNFKVSGRGSLLSTASDPRAINTSRPEVRGRIKFESVGCKSCHSGTVFSGGNFNTGVEAAEDNPAQNLNLIVTPTADTGRLGDGTFNTPQLFGMRKAQFFHTGLKGNHFDANGNPLLFDNIREAIEFYQSSEFLTRHPTFAPAFGALSSGDLDDMTAFLVAISAP